MSQLITTISVLGDDAVMNSLIDGSLTEFIDDIATDVGQYAFYNRFDNLNTIHLQNVITIQQYSFQKCKAKEVILPSIQYIDKRSDYFGSSKTEKYDFTALKEIRTGSSTSQRPFYGCNDIKAFIIRNPEMCTISGSYSPFDSSSIGTIGYIYVPKNLVESYKTASVWSSYADHIRAIEDYPEICDVYSWTAVFKAIDNGTYKDIYKIGDLVPLDLGDEGVIHMEIAAFDTDNLADGSGKAPITWVAKELLATTKRMNPLREIIDGVYTEGTGAIGGWEKCELRAYLNNTIKPMIPESVRSYIKEVTKTQDAYNTAGSKITQTTTDDVWIPTNTEITSQYKVAFSSSVKRKKYLNGVANAWHTRNAYDSMRFRYFTLSGNVEYPPSGTVVEYGIAICFCT